MSWLAKIVGASCSRFGRSAGKSAAEMLSAGAVCMNLEHAANALGYAASWITDWYSYDPEALALFELTADASQETVRRRWRELALQHHPDRGGDAETFIRMRWAWECLNTAR